MSVEILASPKTVRIGMAFRGIKHSAPLEVWITSLVAVMTPEQKNVLFTKVDENMRQWDAQHPEDRARVVADIIAPNILG